MRVEGGIGLLVLSWDTTRLDRTKRVPYWPLCGLIGPVLVAGSRVSSEVTRRDHPYHWRDFRGSRYPPSWLVRSSDSSGVAGSIQAASRETPAPTDPSMARFHRRMSVGRWQDVRRDLSPLMGAKLTDPACVVSETARPSRSRQWGLVPPVRRAPGQFPLVRAHGDVTV